MTLVEFQNQMQRLIEQFGKNAYSQGRAELVWREVKDLQPRWWERTVDHLLGECRQAPLMPEFRDAISKERERLWHYEKAQNAKDAKDFFSSSYQADDVKTICGMIMKRLQGGVSDADYQNFQSMLSNVAKSNPKTQSDRLLCKHCGGDGLVFHRGEDGNEYVYRCSCPDGSKQPQKYLVFNK
jgi:hypothetical protein